MHSLREYDTEIITYRFLQMKTHMYAITVFRHVLHAISLICSINMTKKAFVVRIYRSSKTTLPNHSAQQSRNRVFRVRGLVLLQQESPGGTNP